MLTGLAALAEPATAHMAEIENVGLTQQQERACAMQSHAAVFAAGPISERPDEPKICPRPQIVVMLPPLMLQVDRAHE